MENMRKTNEKHWENQWKTVGKPTETNRKTDGKQKDNRWKTPDKTNGKQLENQWKALETKTNP